MSQIAFIQKNHYIVSPIYLFGQINAYRCSCGAYVGWKKKCHKQAEEENKFFKTLESLQKKPKTS